MVARTHKHCALCTRKSTRNEGGKEPNNSINCDRNIYSFIRDLIYIRFTFISFFYLAPHTLRYTVLNKGVSGFITALTIEIVAATPTAPAPKRGNPKNEDKGQVAAGVMTKRGVRQKTTTSNAYIPYRSLVARAS